jgi:type IV pilus assembly protein PilB
VAPPATTSGATTELPGLIPASGKRDPRRRLGDVVIELGFADRELVEQVMEADHDSNEQMGAQLLKSGILDPDQLARALAERNSLDYVDLNVFEVDQGAVNLIEPSEARRFQAVPIAFLEGGALLVATHDPSNVLGSDDIAMATGREVRRAIGTPEGVERVIGRLTGLSESVREIEESEPDAEADHTENLDLRASAAEAPVVKLVHAVVADAVNRGASDIHFDPSRDDMQVRYRVDGVMIDSTTVPKSLVAGLVSRIKIMADLDIAERRAPQDGRVAVTVDGRHVDIRISTLPVIRGESVVMRILDKDRVVLDLEALGMRSEDRTQLLQAVRRNQGAVLASGPTGAGKTTTLYALLRAVNAPEKTLISIEDPVEYEIDGIKQIHVNPSAGVTFSSGLRSMVRSDPDTLMVGEIRDRETAQMAMEAALTGHLVLSTLHTNNASLVAARLVDMGVEPFLIASGITCVVGQRLARRLCDACKQPAEVTEEELAELGADAELQTKAIDAPVGCVNCNGTGYRGRIGLFEILTLNDEVRNLIVGRAPGTGLEAAAAAAGMHSLREDGLEKVGEGITSLAEVARVLGSSAA